MHTFMYLQNVCSHVHEICQGELEDKRLRSCNEQCEEIETQKTWGQVVKEHRLIGYYKPKEHYIFIMWCLPHLLDHFDLGLDFNLGGTSGPYWDQQVILPPQSKVRLDHSQHEECSKVLVEWHVRGKEKVGPNSFPFAMLQSFLFTFILLMKNINSSIKQIMN